MFSSILRKNSLLINDNMKEYLRKQHNIYTHNIIEKQKNKNLPIDVDKYIKKDFKDSEEYCDNILVNCNYIIPNNQVLQIYRIPFLVFWGFAVYPIYLYFRYKKA